MIAKIDDTANEIDVPGLRSDGYPTLYFLPAGKKSRPIQFNRENEVRHKNQLIEFIMEHAMTIFIEEDL